MSGPDRELTAPPLEFIEWARANAIPLALRRADGATGDHPLRHVIGDARVVMLGEATHGASEIATLKHGVLELCFDHLGFDVFGLEAPYPDFLALDDYVHGDDEVDPQLVLGQIYHYLTEEFLAVVEWFRHRNARPGARQAALCGWDPSAPASAARLIVDYLNGVDAAIAADAAVALAPLLTDFDAAAYRDLPWDVQLATASAVQRIAAELADAPFEIRMLGALLAQGERLRRAVTDGEHFAIRERGGADNALRLLEAAGPDAKMIMWAHQAHAQYASFLPGVDSVASLLAEELGDRFVSVGFLFGTGRFRGVDPITMAVRDFDLPPAPRGTLDAALTEVGIDCFALDLRRAPRDGVVDAWLAGGAPQRVMTSIWSDDPLVQSMVWGPAWDKPGALSWVDPRAAHDVIVFVRSISSHHGLDTWTGPFFPTPTPTADTIDVSVRAGPDGLPAGWTTSLCSGPSRFSIAVGDGHIELSRQDVASTLWGDAVISRRFDATTLRGRRVAFMADVESRSRSLAHAARVFVSVQSDGGRVQRFAAGAHEAAVDVPATAGSVTVGMVMSGSGSAHFRNITLRR